jgi:hypothetical protein
MARLLRLDLAHAFEHRRIDLPQSALAPHLFADYYRYGRRKGREDSPPLICCWGGALDPSQYEERRTKGPDRLLREIAEVFAGPLTPDFDLLVLPNPVMEGRSRDQLRADIKCTFVEELLPSTGNPCPSALGFLGYSAGGCVITCLALDLPAACAVGTLGGVGMAEVLLDTGRPLSKKLQFAAFINAGDPLADEAFALRRALAGRGRTVEIRQGPGGHDIEDYLDTGLARSLGAWIRGALFRAIGEGPTAAAVAR